MVGQIFSDLSDRLTKALVTDDFPLYRSIIALPLRIVPRGGQEYTMQTEIALEQDFRLFHAAIRAAQVTDIYRDVQEVRAEPGGGFRVFCTVHIMVRANRVADPFLSELALLPAPDGMRITEVVSAEHHIDWTLGRGSIRPGDGLI